MRFFGAPILPRVISHLTDIEGNVRYFQRWVNRSKYIQFEKGNLAFREPQANHTFVFGGDFCDKGPGDLRIGTQLIDFKTKHPLNVSLIAGNRDIKCRRFTYELSTNIRQRLLTGAPAFWNPKSAPRDYAMQEMVVKTKSAPSSTNLERYVLHKSIEECQTLYLKWMLNETMGCGPFHSKPNTFEYRRMELAHIGGQPTNTIPDEAVTQSFIHSVSPDGVVHQYLKLAQLGDIAQETLFIHGAVTLENMGYVPGMLESDARITDAKEWIEALNDWYKIQIKDWISHPLELKFEPPGHKPLDKYVLFNPKSIVTTNWYTQGKLAPIPEKVVTFLNNAGIYRVVSGHQPFADFPLVIRQANLEVIVGDTGYSDPSAEEDNRGQAIHNLDIIGQGKKSHALIDAVFKDGTSLKCNLPSRIPFDSNDDAEIGHFTEEGQLIRPMNGSQIGSCQLEGYHIIETPRPTVLTPK